MSAAPSARRHGGALGPLALVALAYLPTLATAPGIVAADTKQYLVLDPGRLLATAASMWDPSQFGGHVTHQQIGYLWPMAPWFWAGHALGLPVWITQRLWLGSVLVAAGLGMRWLARHLGLSPAAAFVAALTYQLSPYVLAYVNRTSALLLPWAALPTLLVCTMLTVRRPGWRWPAVAGLVASTAGGLNATAIVLVALGPLLWLWWAARHGPWPRRTVVAGAARLAACGGVTACWWVVGLVVEVRYGADVLAYSETARAVASTASAGEGLRGLGYWLFYGGGVDGAWNSAARVYLANPALQLLGFALAAAGLAGLVAASGWAARRWLAVQAFVALALAAVAFPPDAASPLGRVLLGASGRSTLVLALRSGTRALPLFTLALATGTGALFELAAARWARGGWRRLGAAVAATVVVAANLPALWTGGFVDATLRRPSAVPAWWRDAAGALDDGDGRVLELAGQEFAAYRWGTTTDPLLPGLTPRPLLTRDLLPLGSADTMDLLYALDDRFQQGRAEPTAVAPVARLLGATDVVARLDAADEHYRTPQPGAVLGALMGAPGLAAPRGFGPLEVRVADPARVDGRAVAAAPVATPAVAVFAVTDAAGPTLAAPVAATIVLAGNGDGVVDAAAAGLIDGTRPVRYAADVAADETLAADAPVIVTDSNRRRARQWRGTQDTLGFTEDDRTSTYARDDADARLPLFPEAPVASQTLAVQHGARATASAYGEPNAYRPEDRAAMAADGDLTTAWRVADRADPVGERWRIDLERAQPVPTVRFVQQQRAANRTVARVVVRSEHVARIVTLDESSTTAAGQIVALGELGTSWVDIEIAATTTGSTPSFFGLDAVGFAEIDVGARVDEIVTVPTAVVGRLAPDASSRPLAFVLTRERVDPAERWRSDPEPALVRSFRAPAALRTTVTVQARLHQRAGDDVLAALDGPRAPAVRTSSRLAGVAAAVGAAALDGDPSTAWTSAVDDVVGAWWEQRFDAPRALGRVDVSVVRDAGRRSTPRVLALTVDDGEPVRAAVGDGGRASVDLGGVTGSRLRVTVVDADVTVGVDRRYGEAVALPVGLAEVTVAGAPPFVAPATIDTGCRDDLVTVDSRPLLLRLRAARTDLVAGAAVTLEPCGAASTLTLAPGDHVLRSAPGARTGIDVDRVVLTSNWIASPGSAPSSAGVTVRSHGRTSATLDVAPSSEPQWLVWGEGRNDGWHATVDGHDLGRAAGMVGGGNAWRLEPSTKVRTVQVTWRPQRWVNTGLAVSAVGAAACLAAALWPRPRFRHLVPVESAWPDPLGTRCGEVDRLGPRQRDVVGGPSAGAAIALAIALGLVAHPLYGVALLVVWFAWRRTGSGLAVGAFGPASVVTIGAYVALRQIVSRPAPGYGWPQALAAAHRPALAAVALVALHALGGTPAPQPASAEDHDIGGRQSEQRHDGRVEAGVAEERPDGDDQPADGGDDHPPAPAP